MSGSHRKVHGPLPQEALLEASWNKLIAILLACLSVAFTIVLSHYHYKSLSDKISNPPRRHDEDKAKLQWILRKQRLHRIRRILCMAPVFGIGFVLALLAPRCRVLFDLARHVAEAFALEAFLNLLVDLLGGPEDTSESLASLPPQQFFAVPPCGCCFLLCPSAPGCAPKPWTPQNTYWVLAAAKQFKYVVPTCTVFSLWAQLNRLTLEEQQLQNGRDWDKFLENSLYIVDGLEKCAMFLCLYALFILYKATHDLLHEVHVDSTKMFLTIKGPLFISIMQEQILDKLAEMGSLSVANEASNQNETADWINFSLGAMEMLFVAWLMKIVYSPSLLTTTIEHVTENFYDCRDLNEKLPNEAELTSLPQLPQPPLDGHRKHANE